MLTPTGIKRNCVCPVKRFDVTRADPYPPRVPSSERRPLMKVVCSISLRLGAVLS
jgi:hypothetical protein